MDSLNLSKNNEGLRIDLNYIKYAEDGKVILKDIHHIFPSGGIYLIKGCNASGKSTFLMLLSGIIPNVINVHFSGILRIMGAEINSVKIVREFISYLPQNPINFFLGDTVNEELEQIKIWMPEFDKILNGIEKNKKITNLSTGQQQRLGLVCVLGSGKKFIYLDEPFEYVDEKVLPDIQECINALLNIGTTIFLTNHLTNLTRIQYNHIIDLSPSYKKVEAFPYKKSNTGNLLLNAKSLTFGYVKDKNILDKLNMLLKESECLGIIGSNGSGKTTLFRILSGLMHLKSGEIHVNNSTLTPKFLRGKIKCSFQNPDDQIFFNSVEQEIYFSLNRSSQTKKEIETAIDFSKDFLGYSMEADPFSLSYGQRKVLTCLITFLLNPKILILDEPFASLDMKNSNKILNLIQLHVNRGGAVILSSHNFSFLEITCNLIMKLEHGKLL